MFLAGLVVLAGLAGGRVLGASIRSGGAVANKKEVDGAKLAQEVIRRLGGKPKVWLLFGRDKPELQQKVLDAVRAVDKSIPLVGCDTRTGVFAVAEDCRKGDFLLVGLTGEGIEFKTAMTRFTSAGTMPRAAGELATELEPEDGKGLLLLITDAIISHGHRYDPVAMYRNIQGVLGLNVGIVGGNAAYGNKPVYHNDTIATKALVGLMISGRMRFKIIQEAGKDAISPPLEITKLSGPRQIVEVEGRPVVEVYREYLKPHMDPEKFDAAVAKGGGGFGPISRRFPHALIVERGQLFVRLAHGLAPWGKGRNLPVEGYNIGEKFRTMVITRYSDDQVGCIRKGMGRLKDKMPPGEKLFMIFPCESTPFLKGRKSMEFLETIKAELPEGASAFGFMPCGEHASPYEPDLDEHVGEARYHQLSYPMAVVVANR